MSKRSFYDLRREKIVNEILNTIKKNPNIKDDVLISKLHVNPPFIEKKQSMDFIEDLKNDNKININSSGEVSLCQS